MGLIGIEMGLGYLYWSLVTKHFRRYCPLLAMNFSFVTKGATICYAFSDEIQILSLKKPYFVKIFRDEI